MLPSDAGGGSVRKDTRAVLSDLRRRVATERQRMARAEAVAASHEEWSSAAAVTEQLRWMHARVAALHRKMAERHCVSVALHELHLTRMEAWLDGEADPARRPVFMSSVAAAIGVGSATATMRGRCSAAVVAASSDATARAAYDLEAALGEGPAVSAVVGHRPVVVGGPSLLARWPLYGPAVAELGVHAVAAVPLVLEAACLGALCVYGGDPVIGGDVVAAAGRVGDVLTHSALLAPGDPLSSGSVPRGHVDDASGPRLFDEADYQAIVHQAAGMVSAQCGCGVDDAEDLLRARAFADGQPVERVAQQVLNGELLWR